MGNTIKLFIDSLKYIDHYYNNFNFDFTNKDKLEVWHQALSVIPSDKLQQVVAAYCMSNVYPPSSPSSILENYKTMMIECLPKAEIAFENLLQRIRDNAYDLERVCKKYEKPTVPQIVKMLESDFNQWMKGNKDVSYLKKDFIKLYNEQIIKQENILRLE